MEHSRIVYFITKINQQNQTLNLVNEIENELSINGETHVSIELQLAMILYHNGFQEQAYNKLMYIIDCEVNNANFTFNTVYADAVGIASSFLVDKFFRQSSTDYSQLFDLSFIYLSNHIQNFGYQMFDSLHHRATLLDCNHNYARSLGSRFLKSFSFIPLPMIISDYYFSAQGYILNGNMKMGKENTLRSDYLHRFLEDITIGGKDADEYTSAEMAQLGKERVINIYNKIDVMEELSKFNFKTLLE